jgi:hypothetical protein
MKLQSILCYTTLPFAMSLACGTSDDASNGGGDKMGVAPPIDGSNGQPSNGQPSNGQPSNGQPSNSGSSDPSQGQAGAGSTAPPEPSADPISEECRGFSFEGLKYSPGGTTLPNTCMPFHALTNNPYAVRCIDAWPWYATQFPGDEYCILPPPPDLGLQYGVHPQGKAWFEQVSNGDMSGYDSPTDEFVVQDGEEEVLNYHTITTNEQDANYYRNYVRMRVGSHHMIVSGDDGSMGDDVWGPGSPAGLFIDLQLPSAERPDQSVPNTLEKPEEDSGLYAVLPARGGVTFNMHNFNVRGTPILKEAWTNVWWETDTRVRIEALNSLPPSQAIRLFMQPGAVQDLHYSYTITQPVRLLTMLGHRHAWTTNFSSWVEKPDKSTEIIYQSFDWYDAPSYRYDSMSQNPVPSPENRTDGASSGVRMLMPGEKWHYNCHIEYTAERAAELGIEAPTQSLYFANEAYTGEMCMVFGTTAAVPLGTSVDDATPLPPFAAMR